MNEQTKKEIDFLYRIAMTHSVDDIQKKVRERIKELAQTCPECHGKERVEIQENRPGQDDLVYERLCICQL